MRDGSSCCNRGSDINTAFTVDSDLAAAFRVMTEVIALHPDLVLINLDPLYLLLIPAGSGGKFISRVPSSQEPFNSGSDEIDSASGVPLDSALPA